MLRVVHFSLDRVHAWCVFKKKGEATVPFFLNKTGINICSTVNSCRSFEYKMSAGINRSFVGPSSVEAGYLSDVNTQNSRNRSDSEASSDFVVSAQNLEHIFKQKYKILRQAYEDRLAGLSQVVEDTCAAVLTDEVGLEMRNDPLSVGFLPAHLAEVFTTYLQSERELYVNELILKLSSMELQLSRKNEIIETQGQKIEKLDAELSQFRHQQLEIEPARLRQIHTEETLKSVSAQSKLEIQELSSKNGILLQTNQTLEAALAEHKRSLEEKNVEINRLQTELLNKTQLASDLQLSRDVFDKDINSLRGVEKSYAVLQREYTTVQTEISEYKVRLNAAADELTRCQGVINEFMAAEKMNKQKITHLMHQVDIMLSQEANESSAAVESAHTQMRRLKQQFMAEMQQERKVTLALEAQVKSLRDELDSRERGLRASRQELAEEKATNHDLTERVRSAERELASARDEEQHLKALNAELRLKSQTVELRLHEFDRAKAQEIALLSEQIHSQMQKQYEKERAQLDQRTGILRMQYQNELTEMQSQFRRSREAFQDLSAVRGDSSAVGSVAMGVSFAASPAAAVVTPAGNSAAGTGGEGRAESEAVAAYWQRLASEKVEENAVLRKSIEKAGENIDILRRLLQESKQRQAAQQANHAEASAQAGGSALDRKHRVEGQVPSSAEYQKLQLSVQDLRKSLSQKDSEIRQLQTQIQRLNEDSRYDSIPPPPPPPPEAADDHSSSRADDLEGHVASLKSDNYRLQALVAQLQRATVEKDTEIKTLSRRLKDAEEEVRSSSAADLNESQVKALGDMKKRFEGLIDTYEASNVELEHELNEKTEKLLQIEAQRNELHAKVSVSDSVTNKLKEELTSEQRTSATRLREIKRLRGLIGKVQSQFTIELDEIKRNAADVQSMISVLGRNMSSDVKKNKLLIADAVESAFAASDVRQQAAVRNAQIKLHQEHQEHEAALQSSFTEHIHKQSIEHKAEVNNTVSSIIQRHDTSSRYLTSDIDAASLVEMIRGEFLVIIKSIFDALMTMNLVDSKFVTDAMVTIESVGSGLKSMSVVTAGLSAANVHVALVQSITGALEARDIRGSAAIKYREDIATEKATNSKMSQRVSDLLRENTELRSKIEGLQASIEKLHKDSNAVAELIRIEYETNLQNIKEKMYDLQRKHALDIQALKTENIELEAAWKIRFEDFQSSTKDSAGSNASIFEAKYKSELMKRQSLQNKLAAEEATHRTIVEELEQRNRDLVHRLESVELEWTKLKLEHLHRL